MANGSSGTTLAPTENKVFSKPSNALDAPSWRSASVSPEACFSAPSVSSVNPSTTAAPATGAAIGANLASRPAATVMSLSQVSRVTSLLDLMTTSASLVMRCLLVDAIAENTSPSMSDSLLLMTEPLCLPEAMFFKTVSRPASRHKR